MKNEGSVLQTYLEEINRIPLLTRQEEVELATRAQAGDKEARDKIVRANLRFVVNVAKKYQNRGLELQDLISEGNVGLLTAIEHFEAERGWHFISYAVWWIRQAILKAIGEKGHAIRLPQNRADALVKIEHAKRAVGCSGNSAADLRAVAEMLGMDEALVHDLLNISREPVSLDAPVASENGDVAALGSFVQDTEHESPEDAAIASAMREDIAEMLSTLRPNEARILQLRYGLTGDEPMTLREVGQEYNLSKERIRQIEKQALNRIRQPTGALRLAAYVAA